MKARVRYTNNNSPIVDTVEYDNVLQVEYFPDTVNIILINGETKIFITRNIQELKVIESVRAGEENRYMDHWSQKPFGMSTIVGRTDLAGVQFPQVAYTD